LDKVVEICKIKLKREKCDAREGLIEEGSQIIKEVNASPVEMPPLRRSNIMRFPPVVS
jgi:ferritin-like metal-binding protein YciE